MKKKVSISLIILSILVVSIFLFNFRYTDYNSGIKLYQKGHLDEAKIKLMNVTPQDKKYVEAQNMLSIIDQEIENARIKEEAEKESLRIKEIAQLEEEVKDVPYSDYEKNYQIYKRLCELDPNNDGYLKKMNQYKTLYVKQVDEQYEESQRIMEKRKRDQENAESYDEIAFKLASIDKGKIINRDDVTVNRFRYLLKTLDSKTSETKVQIADMTVKAQQILRDEYGKEVSLLFLMENVNDAIPSGANVKYAEIISAYILLIK
jgi:tetratricopeptide (TPR) repeat protein